MGIVTLENKIGVNIKAGSFALVTSDDIAYLASISDVFRRGILKVEEPGGRAQTDEVACADEFEFRKLHGPALCRKCR